MQHSTVWEQTGLLMVIKFGNIKTLILTCIKKIYHPFLIGQATASNIKIHILSNIVQALCNEENTWRANQMLPSYKIIVTLNPFV